MRNTISITICLLALSAVSPELFARPSASKGHKMEFVAVSKNGKGFVLADSGARFTPWGFNYDHDSKNRLLETYWADEWDSVVSDFQEMRVLGANTVRLHLQVSRFMKSPQETNQESLAMLAQVVHLAETNGLYLDITGLGCYDKKDVPQWYNDLDEGPRWQTQARFWQAVAQVCKDSPAIFCYDLMNEPILSEDKKTRDWTPGAFGDRYFVQRLSLDFAGRSGQQVAKAWVDKMTGAIRKEDSRHLVTIGAIPWALTWPKAKPDFYSREVSSNLDFVSLHFYPRSGEVKKALKALAVYDIGKPIVIEETFPLSCSIEDLGQFIERSKPTASGWLTFYWGETVAEYKAEKRGISEDLTMKWLEHFASMNPNR